MENGNESATVPSRKRVRRAKRPAADANRNLEGDDLQPPAARRAPAMIAHDMCTQAFTSAVAKQAPTRAPRSYDRTLAMSCARCRVYNWKEHEFDKVAVPAKQPRRAPTSRQQQKVVVAASDKKDDIFRWNLSLEERGKRDSRSALPTAKNLATPALPVRRVLIEENNTSSEAEPATREMDSCAMSVDPSTSQMNNCCGPETTATSGTTTTSGTTGRTSSGGSKPALGTARRRRNGVAVLNSSETAIDQAILNGTPPTGRTGSKKRIMGQAAPMPLDRSTNNINALLDESSSGGNSKETRRALGAAETTDGDARVHAADEQNEKQCAQEEEMEKHKKSELAKRAMEELMKEQNFAPVEVIVADAISKDPLGFVHSLRDAKLLRSLEKLAQLREFRGSSEEAKSLRKQRKKEKKREKREKKKQKKLMKLAANCGVSIEQLELEMSMDRSDSRASAPGSRDGSLSLNGSLVGSNTPPALLTPSSSAALSNLPGPPPSSFMNVFPRPSFVPDPLNPLRNLAAECTSRNNDSSGTNTPNGDSCSPLLLPPPVTPTSSSLNSSGECRDRRSNTKRPDGQERTHMNGVNGQGLDEQSGEYLRRTVVDSGCNGGTTPEDEEDEQNAIAISHLFPQFDALQQLKLIKMCTDSKVREADEEQVVSMVLNSDAGPSNKVARTLALIKGKVKEFREINGMRRASEGGPGGSSSTAGDSIQEAEPRLVRIDDDEEDDVDVEDSQDASLLDQARRNVTRNAWSAPALQQSAVFSASQPVETRTTDMGINSQMGTKLPEQLMQSYPFNPQQPYVETLSSCITGMGMTDLVFGLQPRLLSVLEQPITYSPVDDRPPYRTPAVIHTEMAVHEDEDSIYTSEVKVVTDWFNHAPYGAGLEAHMRYWHRVRQRVDVAEWIAKLQRGQVRQTMLNLSRRRKHRTRRRDMRRSKSTEARWPRKLFEHYEGALETARQVMRTVDSASDTELAVLDNVQMKLILLDEDDTAALAYFRPNSPLTVSDPTDDYQGHLLTQQLDRSPVITKDVLDRLDDMTTDEGEARHCLPWLKVHRIENNDTGGATNNRQSTLKSVNLAPSPSILRNDGGPGSASGFDPSGCALNPGADVPGGSIEADSLLKAASFLQQQPTTPYSLLPQPPASNTACYPSHYPTNLLQQSSTPNQMLPNVLVPSVSGVPLMSGGPSSSSSNQMPPLALPPLSTVLDGLQQPQGGDDSQFMQMQAQSMQNAAIAKNPYTDLFYPPRHPHQPLTAPFGFPVGTTAAGHLRGVSLYSNSANNDSFPTTSSMMNCGNTTTSSAMITMPPPSSMAPSSHGGGMGIADQRNAVGLSKATVVDHDMEAFFISVLDECEAVPPTGHDVQRPSQMFETGIDPFLAMDQLT